MSNAPLIQGKVQLGNVHNDQRELLIEECYLRGVVIDPKEKKNTMKKELISNECPENANAKDKKHFYPRLLTATE